MGLENEDLLKLVNEPPVSSTKTFMSKMQKLQIKSIAGQAQKGSGLASEFSTGRLKGKGNYATYIYMKIILATSF